MTPSMRLCKSVFVVDDDAAIRDMLTLALEDEGYGVACASNGLDALTQLRTGAIAPCMILLDLNMPIMTGWEFCRAQQQDPALATIPVVVVSADRSVQHRLVTIDAAGYLPKPIDFNTLLELMDRYCGSAQG